VPIVNAYNGGAMIAPEGQMPIDVDASNELAKLGVRDPETN
jgi:hypothetical protein